jgi:LysM repeat protein
MVVLILHVVAVGGIYAFNQVNAKKSTNMLANISGRIAQATGINAAPALAPAPAVAEVKPAPPAPPVRLPGDQDEPLPTVVSQSPSGGTTVAREVAPPVVTPTKAPAAKPSGPVVTSTASPKAGAAPGTYTVAKGDNPYNIAKKLGVNYQDLLKVNNVADPTKLQIGQVLKVPPKAD